MDRAQLAAQHTLIIQRHYRALTDTGGRPSTVLLDELGALADQHATPAAADIEAWIRRDPQAFERQLRQMARVNGTPFDAMRYQPASRPPGPTASEQAPVSEPQAETAPGTTASAKPTGRKPAPRRTTPRRSTK